MPQTHIHKLLLALACALAMAVCEGQQIFQKTYSTPGYNGYGVSIAEGPLGHFMVLNGTNQPGIPQSSGNMLMRTNPDGNSLWAKQYMVSGTMNDLAAHIAHVGNDMYLITLNHVFPDSSSLGYSASSVSLIDSAGNMLWTTALHDTTKQVDYFLKKTLRIGNANYSVGTTNIAFHVNPYTDTTKLGLVVKTDTLGNLLWAQNYGTYGTFFNDAVDTDDGGLVITGLHIEYNTPVGTFSPVRLIYLKLDSAGNVAWSNNWLFPWGGDVYCIAKSHNGFLIGGFYLPIINENAFILKIDNYGNLLWGTKYTGNGSSSIRIYHILEQANKIVYSTGAGIKVADSLGNYPVGYGDSVISKIGEIISTNDGGFVHDGSHFFQPSDVSIIKHDQSNIGCNYVTGSFPFGPLNISMNSFSLPANPLLTPISSLPFVQNSVGVVDSVFCSTYTTVLGIGISKKQFAVYPNPFSQHINVNIADIELSAVRVLDVLGNAVAFQQNNNGNTLTLHFDKLKSGIYLLQLTDTHGHTHTKKIACH